MNAFLQASRQKVQEFLLPSLRSAVTINAKPGDAFRAKKSAVTMALARSSLRITDDIAPEIDATIGKVCARLVVPRAQVDVYVFPNADLSAFCFLEECPIVVGLSSTMVDALVADELAFVLGHEIGHALFPETQYFVSDGRSLESLIFARAIELSVDRVGLLASGNVEATFRAILKTISGLRSDKLRFDFASFNAEARAMAAEVVSEQQLWSTHPPLSDRFRALVAFSMSDAYRRAANGEDGGGIPIDQANRLVTEGLNVNVDAYAQAIIRRQLTDLAVWLSCYAVRSRRKVELAALRGKCGIDLTRADLERAVAFVDAFDIDQQESVLQEKIGEELLRATNMAPIACRYLVDALEGEFSGIRDEVESASKGLNAANARAVVSSRS